MKKAVHRATYGLKWLKNIKETHILKHQKHEKQGMEKASRRLASD